MLMRALVGIALVASMVLSAVGCQPKNDGQGVRGVSSSEAASMDAQRNHFEGADDPPFTAGTRFAAGQLAESQGSVPQAINQYAEAVKLNPNHHQALYRLGVLYAQVEQYPKAIDAWEQYVKATRGSAVAYSNLGFCYEISGDRGRAEEAYRKGVARDPKNVPCRTNYGLMLARAGREADALAQLQAVLTPAEAHYNLGSVYEQQGRKDVAKVQYRKALELNPSLWEAETRLAQIK
jgi:tetratricopeptide (TPR) repeat protein